MLGRYEVGLGGDITVDEMKSIIDSIYRITKTRSPTDTMEIGCFLCENFMVRVRDVAADSGGHFLRRHGFIRHGDDPRDSRARHGRQRKHMPCNGFALRSDRPKVCLARSAAMWP